MQEKIRMLFDNQISLHEIARQVGCSYQSVRLIALRLGLYEPKRKKQQDDGTIKCLICSEFLPTSQYPLTNLEKSIYRCIKCNDRYLHEYQINKLGCTKEMYDEILANQDGKCAICARSSGHKTCNGLAARLAVDHNHLTGEVRGLLCNRCNRGLGYLENHLDAALKYIKGRGKRAKC